MFVDFLCPECRKLNSCHWKKSGDYLTALIECHNCSELWGVEVSGNEINIYPTIDPVEAVIIVQDDDTDTDESNLRIFENPLPAECEFCGLEYDDFRTGEDFQSIKDDLWVGSEDPAEWNYKGRHTVLGRWYALKQSMWADHLEQCEQAAEGAEDVIESEPWDITDY